MDITKAKQLKNGQAVRLKYKSTPGHGGDIDCMAIVRGGGYDTATVNKTPKGTEYIWVTVQYNGICRAVFGSHFLH